MNYLVLSTPSEAYAAAISSALWGLARPPAVRSEKDTQLYTSWIVKPDESAVALFVPDDTRPVHVDADIDELVDLVGDLDLTLETETPEGTDTHATTLSAHLEAKRGGHIRFIDIVKASPLAAALRTKEELEADGWFPTDELI